MKVTKVVFTKEKRSNMFLASCSVVLDDVLKLTNIRLIHEDDRRYLILPSKEDYFKRVQDLNPDTELQAPESYFSHKSNGQFEEFFFPLTGEFYKELLESVSKAYEECCKTGSYVYRFKY